MKNALTTAWIAGIVSIVLGFFKIIVELLRENQTANEAMFGIFTVFYILAALAGILFVAGFVLIGRRSNNLILIITGSALIAAMLLSYVYDIISMTYVATERDAIGILQCLMFGSVNIIFGIALLTMKDSQPLARVAGILLTVAGAALFSVVLFVIGLILLIPANIFQVMVLHRASKLDWRLLKTGKYHFSFCLSQSDQQIAINRLKTRNIQHFSFNIKPH